MNTSLKELLEKRRNRALSAILGLKEKEVDQYLPSQTQALLRKTILDQINDYHMMVMDVFASVLDGDPTVALNDIYLQKIDLMFDGMERLVASLES